MAQTINNVTLLSTTKPNIGSMPKPISGGTPYQAGSPLNTATKKK